MAMPTAKELVEQAATAIARSKYNGKPTYATKARPTPSDIKYAAAAVADALRRVGHGVPDLVIGNVLDEIANDISREHTP